jgi:hypothetical protein
VAGGSCYAIYFALLIYGGEVSASNWLVQRSVNSFGHCNFNQQETLKAFDDLVLWVTAGQRPAGGDATIR